MHDRPHLSGAAAHRRGLRRALGAALFAAVCFVALAFTAGGAAAAPGDTRAQAIQRGVNFLGPDVVGFTDANHCIACHRQGAALFALSLAKGTGFTIDLDPTVGTPHIAQAIAADQSSDGHWWWAQGPTLKTSYNFYGLAGYDANVSTAYSNDLVAASDWALAAQQSDGHWPMDFEDGRTAHGDMTTTARFMVGLAQAMQRVDPNKAASYQAALTSAVGYITAHQDDASEVSGVPLTYELSWALIGLKAAGLANDDPTVQALIAQLQTRQSNLGFAWGTWPGNGPDPFNTGMATYALCKAGILAVGNPFILSSLNWLNQAQGGDGTWGSDVDTTFGILGLACYGDHGVNVTSHGPSTQIIAAGASGPQTATYQFDIQNHGFVNDSYTLKVLGGLPGWTGTIAGPVAVAAGATTTVTLTVNAPAHLLPALPVQMSLIATSMELPLLISASAHVTTLTDPPPPTSGDPTAVTILGGNGAVVALGQPVTLSATVKDTASEAGVTGPGKGVVTFFVAGLAVAVADDSDGDGVYTVSFTPDCDWTLTGPQDLRAIYSGIDLPVGQTDLLSSLAAGTLVVMVPACCARPEICDGVDNDCDGVIDNGFNVGVACSAGVGACVSAGTIQCSDGGSACNAVAGAPKPETCDGVDNDCDGVIDNGFQLGAACTNGVGACQAAGTRVCDGEGGATCNAVPGAPMTEICGDLIDSDCDGNTDNGCACLTDEPCGGPTSGQICATGTGASYTCVLGCRGAGGNGCSGGLKCTSTTEVMGACVACLVDQDCSGAGPGVVCDASAHACVRGCRGTDVDPCSGHLVCTSTDASIGACVECLVDSACGDAQSGRVCVQHFCNDGCRGTNGNGCASSDVCSSTTNAVGTCIETGHGGVGGASGAGGQCPTSTPSSVGFAPGGNGLLCSVQPGNDARGEGWLFGFALAALVRWRRRQAA